MKMGIEAGYTVDLIEGNLTSLRKAFELRLGQKAVAQLDGSQFVENHSGWSRVPTPLLPDGVGARSGLRYFRILEALTLPLIRARCLFAQSPRKGRPSR
jgi:hypothetical protein